MNVFELYLGARKPSVTVAGGTTFLHVNTLARLTGTTEICIKEVKFNFTKPTVVE